jgi:mannose-6-phosphate isomerase-like protein (cupin superfamily)
MTRIVEKGWGHEEIWAETEAYCGKILHMRSGKAMSMHFHAKKHETWRALNGAFIIEVIDTKTSKVSAINFGAGETFVIPPLLPHRLICDSLGTVIEVSTFDDPDDNHRVMPGDSQK